MISHNGWSALFALLAAALAWGALSCTKEKEKEKERSLCAKTVASQNAPPKRPSLKLEWDPKTGKGAVIHTRPSGDRFRTCFHCGYPKYEGGLIIGSYSGSGFGFYPKKPIRGHRKINVFCAQDESIWDLDEKKEYTYGWSENYGKENDGEALKYVKGRVLTGGPDQIVLQSVNGGGCYRVTKVAYTRADASWWILATRITNTCDHPIHFDFFSGDDPWLGLYRTSDGDVGWTPDGLIRHERLLGLGRFTVGGNLRFGQRTVGTKGGELYQSSELPPIGSSGSAAGQDVRGQLLCPSNRRY